MSAAYGILRAWYVVMPIAAGLVVAFAPRLGGYLVAVWLLLISVNMLGTEHLDIAVRDLGLAVGALALAFLAGARSSTPARAGAPS